MTGYRGDGHGADCVAVDLDSRTDEGLRECADALYGTGCPALGGVLLRRYPGCLLVTLRGTPGGHGDCRCPARSRSGRDCVAVVLRSGARIVVTHAPLRHRALSAREHGALAIRLHGLLVARWRPGGPEYRPWTCGPEPCPGPAGGEPHLWPGGAERSPWPGGMAECPWPDGPEQCPWPGGAERSPWPDACSP
ncbi:hypothetical protein [Streptomyces sp. NPDC048845]|uniref:hypothetical protein n=1 Tax=Streptomyces sp. NPDC048845 TaxID=3155390 RepID=UPI00341C77C4